MTKSLFDAPGGGGGGNTPKLESGAYGARLVQVIELGLQPQKFKDEEKEPRREVMLTYEFGDEFMLDEDGQELKDKPRWLSETFPVHNIKADRAKSTARYKVFDPKLSGSGLFVDFLGAPVTVFVVQNPGKGANSGKVYENIESVSPMREKEAARAPDLVNEAKVFDIDDPDLEIFLALPKWIQEKIQGNLEFEGSKLQELLAAGGHPAKAEANSGADAENSEDPDDEDNPY